MNYCVPEKVTTGYNIYLNSRGAAEGIKPVFLRYGGLDYEGFFDIYRFNSEPAKGFS